MRESSIDDKITDYLKANKIYGVKIHGSANQTKTVDWHICYKGRFLAVETKVPGKLPDPVQRFILAEIKQSGGYKATVIELADLQRALEEIDRQISNN